MYSARIIILDISRISGLGGTRLEMVVRYISNNVPSPLTHFGISDGAKFSQRFVGECVYVSYYNGSRVYLDMTLHDKT